MAEKLLGITCLRQKSQDGYVEPEERCRIQPHT